MHIECRKTEQNDQKMKCEKLHNKMKKSDWFIHLQEGVDVHLKRAARVVQREVLKDCRMKSTEITNNLVSKRNPDATYGLLLSVNNDDVASSVGEVSGAGRFANVVLFLVRRDGNGRTRVSRVHQPQPSSEYF